VEAVAEDGYGRGVRVPYQPDGWSKPYRFVALRKPKPREEQEGEEMEQYQLSEPSQYRYRVS
jgi:hypothetical protein